MCSATYITVLAFVGAGFVSWVAGALIGTCLINLYLLTHKEKP